MRSKLKKQWQYHLMLVPGVILVFIFSYIPLYGLIIAFQKYNPGMGFSSPWVGFDNFKYLFSQPVFLRTIWNTFYIAFFKLVGGIVVPVFFALLLNEVISNKLKRTFQTLIYIPNFLSWVIMAGVLMDLLAKDGAFNQILSAVGLPTINFLGSIKGTVTGISSINFVSSGSTIAITYIHNAIALKSAINFTFVLFFSLII